MSRPAAGAGAPSATAFSTKPPGYIGGTAPSTTKSETFLSKGVPSTKGDFRHLSKEELTEFREIFSLVDKDGGGSISKDELLSLMETLGISASAEEIDLMVREIDLDGNDEIDFEEFVAVMSRKVSASYTPAQVKSAFKIFEGSAPPGFIKITDLVKAIQSYSSQKLTEEQISELMSQLEPDANGYVNYSEYLCRRREAASLNRVNSFKEGGDSADVKHGAGKTAGFERVLVKDLQNVPIPPPPKPPT